MAGTTKKIVTPEERAEQVREVIACMNEGMSETASCAKVGINRATFRNAALRNEADSEYARALVALAQDQINLTSKAIEDMRKGIIDSQMARVEIDTRKWFASKFLPKQYGDKVQTDVTSGGQPISFVIGRESTD